MYVARKKGHVEVVRVLGEFGADLNTAEYAWATPTSTASKNDFIDVVRVMGDLRADLLIFAF